MFDWQRQSVLKEFQRGAGHSLRQDSALCICELPFRGKLVLQTRADDEAIHASASAAIGQALPLEPNTSTMSGNTILWMKPGKWMIISDPGESRQIKKNLESALADFAYLISDASDARTGIEISGHYARTLLSRVCSLDLHPQSFMPGSCAQTALVRIPMLIHLADERPCFHLYVDRSVARYAWDWLNDAATEFDGKVSPA
jgi:sarcosine oxidase subunit gamma